MLSAQAKTLQTIVEKMVALVEGTYIHTVNNSQSYSAAVKPVQPIKNTQQIPKYSNSSAAEKIIPLDDEDFDDF